MNTVLLIVILSKFYDPIQTLVIIFSAIIGQKAWDMAAEEWKKGRP